MADRQEGKEISFTNIAFFTYAWLVTPYRCISGMAQGLVRQRGGGCLNSGFFTTQSVINSV